MSTRATYEFRSNFHNPVVIYKHHDGYPEGAVEHLEGVRTAEQFIRKIDEAEITDSHELHGDTEYRYYITPSWEGDEVRADKREYVQPSEEEDNEDSWRTIFTGSFAEFKQRYGE